MFFSFTYIEFFTQTKENFKFGKIRIFAAEVFVLEKKASAKRSEESFCRMLTLETMPVFAEFAASSIVCIELHLSFSIVEKTELLDFKKTADSFQKKESRSELFLQI